MKKSFTREGGASVRNVIARAEYRVNNQEFS